MHTRLTLAKQRAQEAALRTKTATLTLFRLLVPPLILLFAGYHLVFLGRIYPGVEAADVPLGGKTAQQALTALAGDVDAPEAIVLVFQEQEFTIDLSELGFSYNLQETVNKALVVGREDSLTKSLITKFRILWDKETLPLAYDLNGALFEEKIAAISSQLASPALEPTVNIQAGKVIVHKGKEGQEVDVDLLKRKVSESLSLHFADRVQIPIKVLSPQLTEDEAENLKSMAEKLVGKTLFLKFEDVSSLPPFDTFSYPDEELVSLLTPKGGLDKNKVQALVENIVKGINREPQNAVFEFKNNRVQEFLPAKDGVSVKEAQLVKEIEKALEELIDGEKEIAISIPVNTVAPKITTKEVNDLGINELIGRGTSRFRGSVSSRIHNIGLAASRISGTLVAPGEIFSFNRALGDVSVYTGYQQAYIIQEGRTILGDGGGVCQVSTTFFRAALNAGLPILERHQHSYRVGYYEQDSKAGVDATVYVPSVNLRVKNDTPGHILVQSVFNPTGAFLAFEIYGTADGREVTLSEPRVWDFTAPPPPLYQDDPTLPAGTTKQIDFAAWGAKAAFDYRVERAGEVLQNRTFYSNFRPWQAVYLRGAGPTQ